MATSVIYQFKVSLKRMKPPVWRRIQVSRDINFAEFHEAIRDCMDWSDVHMHQFIVEDPRTGNKVWISTPYCSEIISEERARIAQYFVAVQDKAIYEYDLGSTWTHDIVLEKILHAEEGVEYPRCVKSKGVRPVEDYNPYDSDSSE